MRTLRGVGEKQQREERNAGEEMKGGGAAEGRRREGKAKYKEAASRGGWGVFCVPFMMDDSVD